MRLFRVSLAIASLYASQSFAADPVGTPLPAPVATAPVTNYAPPPQSAAIIPPPVIAELNDGSKVEFDADGSVMVLQADGSRTTAPTGILTLKDGTPFVVKDGKRVSEEDQ